MKKLTILAIVILSGITLFAQKGFRNPSAAYCEHLGYRYSIQKDAKGNEKGMCLLPDGNMVNAWDFYKGKIAHEYNYGALKGYETETETVKVNGYNIERAVYVRSNKSIEERYTLEELMNVYGESIDLYGKEIGQDIREVAKTDPNFTNSKSIPTSFDWRSYNGHSYIGAVRNQGGCGSCYAFGASAAAEGTYNFATNSYDGNCADFSESYIAWCLSTVSPYSSHFSGCNGADYEYYELQALVDIGTIDESYFPYTDANNQSCPSSTESAPKIKFEAWYRVPCADNDAIKTAIITYGVVDAAVYVTTSFQNYTGGVFSDSYTTCNTNPCYNATTNHAIALVGWGTDPVEGDYWILRNSWGSSWGESGYMRLSMNSSHVDCSVCYMVYQDDGTTVPVLSTNNVSSIQDNSAICGGNITSDGGNTVIESGLVYSKNTNPTTTSGTKVTTSPTVTTGSYNQTLTGLLTGTTYYVRAFATNGKGTSYGDEKTFTTTGISEPEYCQSAGADFSYEWISSITVGSFTNSSGATGYTDFTSLSTNLTAGETYSISLLPGFSSSTYNEYWKIWIDLNHDGDFEDTGENVFDQGGMSSSTVSGNITIPVGTAAVTTRMRITMKYNGEPTSCENTFSYGEVEDYTVNIGEGSGNTAPVAEANGPYSADLGNTITFSSAGSFDSDGTIVSYDWNFGDGNSSTLANPSYTYPTVGNYTATLTVTDDGGLTGTDQATVAITGIGGIDELSYTDFESGWSIWTDGGGDCVLYTAGTYAYEGNNAADIQDNSGTASSFYMTNGVDVHTPEYIQIDVEFHFIAISMDNSFEDFWVQYYDGSTWNTAASFARTTDFDNGSFYSVKVTILEADYTFPTDMKIRFMCDASGNKDDIYIDNIKISASTNRFINQYPVQINKVGELTPELFQELSIYPNPVYGSEITVHSLFEISNFKVYDVSGRLVKEEIIDNKLQHNLNISDLKSGIYILKAQSEEESQTIRFVKE